MKVLLIGANSYTGSKLLPILLAQGHEPYCLVRDPAKFRELNPHYQQAFLLSGNLLNESSIEKFPKNVDAAYYLVHSLTESPGFDVLEILSAHNFMHALNKTQCRHVIYLAGAANKKSQSRKQVEEILKSGPSAFTAFHSSVIIGPGSIFLDIIKKFIGKGPVVAVPYFIKIRTQPIAIQNVLEYLISVLLNARAFNHTYELCGPEILSFKEILTRYTDKYQLSRFFLPIPVLSTILTNYRLSDATGMPYSVVKNLGKMLLKEAICNDEPIQQIAAIKCMKFEDALPSIHAQDY